MSMGRLIFLLLATCLFNINLAFGKGTILSSEGNVPDIEEYNALVEFYNATEGNNWFNNSDWTNGSSHNDFGNWFGVTVVDGDVVALELPENNLVGRLPQQMEVLTELRLINFENNHLDGEFPTWFSAYRLLETLSLANNKFVGALPNEIGDLHSLKILDLNNNQFDSYVPHSIGNLTNLTFLSLSTNGFSGTIPASIGNLTSLTSLALNENSFLNGVPSELGNLNQLIELNLSNNQLQGRIPETIFNISTLKYLLIHHNQLTGPLSSSVSKLNNLIYLNLSNNRLSGTIPSNISSINTLRFVDLAVNAFSGEIPTSLQQLPQLTLLAINNNQLSVLPYLGNLANKSSITIHLGGNKFDLYDLDPYFISTSSSTLFGQFTYAPQNPIERTEVVSFTPGNVVRLDVQQGNSKFKYQWQRKVNNSWINITGEIGYFYRIAVSTIGDEGLYRCIISHDWANQVSHPSKEILLKIKQQPQIATAPSPQILNPEPSWVTETIFNDSGNPVSEQRE